MPITIDRPTWQQRINQIESEVEGIRFPTVSDGQFDQDAEWCEVTVEGQTRRMRFHDYADIYDIPGLYEELFYGQLHCCSPSVLAQIFDDVLPDSGHCHSDLRVLDVGAGNGMVGDELHARGVERLVGVDIIREAKEATLRDRPGLYDEYFVADLTALSEQDEEAIRKTRCNCLTVVAALGYGDIPPEAFIKALDLIETPSWLGFTIKEDFLHEEDSTGFSGAIGRLSKQRIIQVQAYRRYQHRVSMTGEPLHYVAMVARKLRDLPDGWLATAGNG